MKTYLKVSEKISQAVQKTLFIKQKMPSQFLIYFITLFLMYMGCTLQAQDTCTITVKSGAARQTFSGFGTSHASTLWNNIAQVPRNTMTSMVYGDLNINVFRMWLNYSDSLTVAEMVAQFNTSYIASGAIADVKNQGVETLLLTPARGGSTPAPASIATYANNIAEIILQLKSTYNIEINVTGIANEPENMWSSSQIVECVKELRSGLDSRGLTNVKIIASEASNPNSAGISVKAIREDEVAWNSLYGIASHSYGSVDSNGNMGILKQNKPWWVTEASGNDVNEVGEDENQSATILARFLDNLNHEVDQWFFFIDFGQVSDITTYPLGTGFLMLYDQQTATVVPLLKYYYFKQALETFGKGSVFRKCVSDTEGEMSSVVINGANQNPAINAAAAYNPDGSWGITIINDTGINNGLANSSNLFYPAASYNITIVVEELASTPSMDFTLFRSSANNHIQNNGTVTFINGVGTVSVASRELVSLRSSSTPLTIPPAPVQLKASSINAPVSLNWHNTAGATSWNIKRSTISGGNYTTIATTDTTHYDDLNALNGVQYYYVVTAVNDAGESPPSSEVTVSPTPFPWLNTDIGDVEIDGYVEISDDAIFSTYGAGGDLLSSADSFNFTYQTMTGDGTVIVRLTEYSTSNSRLGIMMCEALGTAPKAVALIYNTNGIWLREMLGTRATDGGSISWSIGNTTGVPIWLKLNRTGDIFTGYASDDGINWTMTASKTVAMNDTVYIGLVNSHNQSLCNAVFDNIIAPCQPVTGLNATQNAGRIDINWTAAYGATQYNIKRATDINGPFTTIATLDAPEVKYTDYTLTPGTTGYYIVAAENSLGETVDSVKVSAYLDNVTTLTNTDIGDVGTSGSYNVAADGTITVTGAGGNFLTPDNDSFNYTFQNMTGDCTITVCLESYIGSNARLGLMMSETLDNSSKAVSVIYNTNGVWLRPMMGTRSTEGTSGTWSIGNTTGVPIWLKLNRTGDVFTGYESSDGVTWNVIQSQTVGMANSIYIGLVAVKAGTICTGHFTDFSITTPVPKDVTALSTPSKIELSWSPSEYISGYDIKRAADKNGPYTTIATLNAQATSYTDTSVSVGNAYFYMISAISNSGVNYDSTPIEVWSNVDIGTVGLPGSCTSDSNGLITIKAAGTTVGGTNDAFNYTCKTMTGDGTLIVHLNSGNRANSKVGIMMSESLGSGSKSVGLIYNFNGYWNRVMMYTRLTDGASGNWSTNLSNFSTVPVWLKLTRVGNVFTGYASYDGVSWSLANSGTIAMSNTIYIGLVNASSSITFYSTGVFSEVSAP